MMRTSIRNRTIATVLVAGVLIPAAPAIAAVEDPFAKDLGGTSGSAPSSSVELRRDASAATPFVAEVGPEAVTAAGDGFDWSDAAIGAGAGLVLATFAAIGTVSLRERREHAHDRIAATPSV